MVQEDSEWSSESLSVRSLELDRISGLLQRLPSFSSVQGQGLELEINFNGLSFAKITGAAFLTAYLYHLRRVTQELDIEINGLDPYSDVSNYLDRMRFFELADIPVRQSIRDRSEGEGSFQEITPVEPHQSEAALQTQVVGPISKILRQQFEGEPGKLRGIEIVFRELVLNIVQHAETEHPGFVAAQTYSGSQYYPKRVELAIIDLGIGIPESLSRNLALEEVEESPLELATELGVTGKQHNPGQGLYVTRELIKKNGGQMALFSDYHYLHQTGENRRNRQLDTVWPGTLVLLSYHMDSELPLR